MGTKLYIVYDHENVEKKALTKGSVFWFGTEENKARQAEKMYLRYGHPKTKIAVFDLNECETYTSVDVFDKQAQLLDKHLCGFLDRNFGKRITKSISKQETNVGITTIEQDNGDDKSLRSRVHDNVTKHSGLGRIKNEVLPIMIDAFMKETPLVMPVNIKIDGKLYKRYEPTKE